MMECEDVAFREYMKQIRANAMTIRAEIDKKIEQNKILGNNKAMSLIIADLLLVAIMIIMAAIVSFLFLSYGNTLGLETTIESIHQR